jgi:hypothetical protein
MSYAITYTTGGTTFNLDGYDAVTGFTFNYQGDQGFGLAPMHRITQRGPMQHGDSDVDFRLDPRIMQIPIFVATTTLDDYYAARGRLLSVFSPSNSVGTITVTTSTWARSIDVKVLGGMSFDTDAKVGYSLSAVIQLRADDPTWYDDVPHTVSGAAGIAGTATAIPLVIPLTFGTANINTTTSFTYDGTWLAYPIITALGPITGLIITNNTTGQIITTAGSIAAGRTYTYDLRYGRKTVYDDLGNNQIATVAAASTLATWAIVTGINSVTIAASASASPAAVSIIYYTRYIGI